MYRLAFDIGGTFTDFVLHDLRDGSLKLWKVPSTPDKPARAVIEAVAQHSASLGFALGDVETLLHATTVATNAILERKGNKTALITTAGFRDVLLMGRAKRPDTNDLRVVKPKPLVERADIFEVRERVGFDGRVIVPLDEAGLREVLERIRAQGYQSVAVMFLHAYANAAHERLVLEAVTELGLQVDVTLSSDVSPKSREYERASTTVANSYVKPLVGRYVDELAGGLRAAGAQGDLTIMQSNGGLVSAELARLYPIRIVESGPAAGVLMCAEIGRQQGFENVMTFDMGGTTAKLGAIEGGEPAITTSYEVDAVNAKKGSGLPLNILAIELLEIGAGGGSLAATKMGLIGVGPESAGAMPGPVCYGRGGVRPTVTDANLVLGYLNSDYFNGGEMRLDLAGARDGLQREIAGPLGLSVQEAAWGVHSVANSNMERAMRVISVERGRDPRDYALVAFGGAGPLHACRLARGIGVKQVIVPRGAGVGSAIGLLVADYKVDASMTRLVLLGESAAPAIAEIFAGLEARVLAEAARLHVAGGAKISRIAAMHHVGQGFEIRVELPSGLVDDAYVERAKAAFYATYEREYGYRDPAAAIEVTDWYVVGTVANPSRAALGGAMEVAEGSALAGSRMGYFPERGGMTECAVLNRYAMRPGEVFPGPCFVEERESTTVVLPGDTVRLSEAGHLVIDIRAEAW